MRDGGEVKVTTTVTLLKELILVMAAFEPVTLLMRDYPKIRAT